ncbi:hypothetical protein IEQ34_022765 [Dendrobium chrysotoxum]|uniref:Uncharacterized protein n=1 Tax=Dendrobium chrysotoxum TaxID=161865 RepID=A0AAV7FK86_DENCH|nr:hypothetical protein IEQ34_022765 [Dendrobium chrysotoxum]
MGCSFSSVLTVVNDKNSIISSKAMVVATNGSLLEYTSGIRTSEVVMAVGKIYMLCNSDKLYFDAYPPAMASDEELVSGQIYFLLPAAELDQRLSAANVATLAFRASTAMKQAAKMKGRKGIRVSPMTENFDVELGTSGRNFELVLAQKTTDTKKKYKRMVGVRSKRSKALILAIDNEGNSPVPSKAMVVATDGSLLEYSGGICAFEVITAVGKIYTLCNSDNLFFDAYPPAMTPNEVLVSGQVYFLLPVAELNQRLSGANLAALAIRASTAMKQTTEKQGRRRVRVLPVAEVFDVDVGNSDRNLELRLISKTTETKKKCKGVVGVRSKRSRRVLSTIEEVDEN